MSGIWLVVGGLIGWFAHTFVRDPIAEFLKLRRNGMRAILIHENTGPPPSSGPHEDERSIEKRRKAIADGREELLGLSRDFRTLLATDPWLFSLLRGMVDLDRAAEALASLANCLNEWRPERAEYSASYKKALRLK